MLVAAVAAGCSGPADDSPRPTEPPAALIERFATFDAWARRVLDGDHLFDSDAAFREALFAPIRSQEDVVDACVEERAATTRTACLRGGAAPAVDARWVEVRSARIADLRMVADPDDDSRVVLARSARRGVVEVRVVVAFEGGP